MRGKEHPVDFMDWIGFTDWLEAYYCKLGYGVVKLGPSGDKGVDLVLESGGKRTGVQVKYRSSLSDHIGIDAVQQAYAGARYYGCSEAWVVANTYFTKQAVEMASKIGVKLIDRSDVTRMKPKSPEEVLEKVLDEQAKMRKLIRSMKHSPS